jgi:hypothetical protein
LATDQPEERQPTRINILTYLSNLAALVPTDGLLLVSFAGHGIERGGQAYLIPSDARLSHDVSLLEESAVSVTRMHDRIKAIGVGQVIVLLDACRNDPGGRADAPNNMSAAYAKFNFDVRNREVQAFATLYATAIGQRAYEYTEKRQGYFTWAIVEGLKGGAANDKGEVTLAALINYVQGTVPKKIAIDLGAYMQQRPFAIVEGYKADELVIAVANNTLTTLGSSSTIKIPPTTSGSVGSVTDDRTGLNNEAPLARVMSVAFAKDYIDKTIRVRVRFIAAGQSEAWLFTAIPAGVMENRVAFRVSTPDEPVKPEVAFGSVPPHVFIDKEKANLVFELKSGDLIVLTGSTVVGTLKASEASRAYGGRDFTQVIFVATSITKVD